MITHTSLDTRFSSATCLIADQSFRFAVFIILCISTLLFAGCRTVNPLVPPDGKTEREYKERLALWLNDKLPPEARYSARLFLSQEIINELLVGLADAEIPLSTSQPTKFKIKGVQ